MDAPGEINKWSGPVISIIGIIGSIWAGIKLIFLFGKWKQRIDPDRTSRSAIAIPSGDNAEVISHILGVVSEISKTLSELRVSVIQDNLRRDEQEADLREFAAKIETQQREVLNRVTKIEKRLDNLEITR